DTKEDGRFVIDMNNVGITIENKEVVSSINIIVDKIKREVFKYSNQKDIKVNTSNKKYYGEIEPTNRQIKVVNDFEKLLKKGNGTMFVAGLAGAGKTTAIGAILQVAKESNKLPDVQFRTKVKTTLSVLKNMGQQFGVELDPENFNTVDTLFEQSKTIGYSLTDDTDVTSILREESGKIEGKIIIIDESHKLEDDMFVPIMEKLSRKNIIVFAGDPKQIGDGEEFNKQTYLNPEGENVTILNETNRGNQDINLVNKLNAYTQDVLKNSGYNGIVVTDSDSFIGYEDVADGKGIVITYENKTRKKINKDNKNFNESIKEGDKLYSIGSNTTNGLLINVVSDAKEGKRKHSNINKLSNNRKVSIFSYETPSEYSWKENEDGTFDLVIYATSNTTELKGDAIKKLTDKIPPLKGKKVNVYTLGYAITSHKGAGQSFDEVTIHKEVLDKFGFDSIKYFYDSVTRARSKVYYPLNHPNLIGVTTTDGNKLLAGDSKDVNFIITENRKKDKVQKLVLPQITYYSNAILGRQILDYMSDSKNKISQQKLGSITLYSNDGNQNLINEYKKSSVDLNNEYTLSDIGKLYNSLVSSGYLIDNEYINQKVNGFTFKSSKGDIIPVKGIIKKERGGLDITIDKANWIAEDINIIADDIINRIDDGFINESVHKMQ
ncbi:MAG TPA: AAA family ATPase, partial [Candidatus Absconditabacterales bacterium]|nr:AAA family ATPase [Candidatus Absconditabacterales bacterium]